MNQNVTEKTLLTCLLALYCLCLFSLISYMHNPNMLPCLSYVYWVKI